jgi:hypothetical protein
LEPLGDLLEFQLDTIMRKLLISLLLAAALPALAQTPPRLEPLPAPPPPPPGMTDEDGPRVNIPVQREDKVEEVRQNGRVVMMKVTPPNGLPYYLVDTTGNGNWMRREGLDPGISVPMWTIKTFD